MFNEEPIMMNKMTEFTARPTNPDFMSLVSPVPGVTIRGVLERFPEGMMEGWVCESKGYDGAAVGFVHVPTGLELYAYARWGVVRVGCRINERPDAEAIAQGLAALLAAPAPGRPCEPTSPGW